MAEDTTRTTAYLTIYSLLPEVFREKDSLHIVKDFYPALIYHLGSSKSPVVRDMRVSEFFLALKCLELEGILKKSDNLVSYIKSD